MNKPCKLIKGGLYVSNHGWFAPCFNSYHHILDTSGLNIKDISIKDYYNSEWLNTYDTNIANNGSDPRCRNCYHEEELGKNSFRLKNLNKLDIDTRIGRNIQLNIGNLCNNACVTCNPYQSSKIAQEWQQLNFYTDYPEFNDFIQGYDPKKAIAGEWWVNDPTKLDSVLTELVDLQPTTLNLIGGEPTVNPVTKVILKKLLPVASNLEISFTTNGRVFDPELVELLSHFKKYSIRISIDGYKDLNEFVRYPSTWSEFETITPQWINTNASIRFNIGLSALTAFRLDELLTYLDSMYPYNEFEIWHLQDPSFLHCKQLPQLAIDQAINKLSTITVSENIKHVQKYAINHLLTIQSENSGKLKKFVSTICQIRRLDINDVQWLIAGDNKL
jgi:MoaA/NifB/PqqE/SkfB family radical SAM enzyme